MPPRISFLLAVALVALLVVLLVGDGVPPAHATHALDTLTSFRAAAGDG